MSEHFEPEHFYIDQDDPTNESVASEKILEFHIPILQELRYRMFCPIWPSQHSGYRSIEWEHAHGRAGTSQHCFKGKGAVDVACYEHRLDELYDFLTASDYMRVCKYPNFVHCDFYGQYKMTYKCAGGANDPWIST